MSETIELVEVLSSLIDIIGKILDLPRQSQAVDVIKAILYSGLTRIAVAMNDSEASSHPEKLMKRSKCQEILGVNRQREIMEFCQKNTL